MRRKYIHELPEWPDLHWRHGELAEKLAEVRFSQGRLVGRMETLGLQIEQETNLAALTGDVVKSSEIEGEILNPDQVRSSVEQRLGLDTGGSRIAGQNVEGIVELMLDATQNFRIALTGERLFGWHATLFPTGRSGGVEINAGRYRTGEMQVVSGPIGRQKVHFEAPPPRLVEEEMHTFVDWFNASNRCRPRSQSGTGPSVVRYHPSFR